MMCGMLCVSPLQYAISMDDNWAHMRTYNASRHMNTSAMPNNMAQCTFSIYGCDPTLACMFIKGELQR